jgi:hypothetical protein
MVLNKNRIRNAVLSTTAIILLIAGEVMLGCSGDEDGGSVTDGNDLVGDWILYGDDYFDFLSFGTTSFEGSRYTGTEYHGFSNSGKYYTIGDNLYFVIEAHCFTNWDANKEAFEQCLPQQTVVLPYSVSGTGDNRILTIYGDVWRVRQTPPVL